MNKGIAKLIIYSGAVIIAVLVTMIANKLLDRDSLLDRISKWPDLLVYTLDGEQISTSDMVSDKPRILYYFNTECIFCQVSFDDLPNQSVLVEEATLLFISNEDPEVIRNFFTDNGLENMSGVHIYHDADQRVKDFFAIRGVPAIYLYNREGEMIELFRGATSLERIRSEIQEELSLQ